jgi:cytoskeletal protein CcmA (bactofilin family)
MKADKITVPCPKCGHAQQEPASAYSTVCKKCGQHFRIQDAPAEAASFGKAAPGPAKETRRVSCFNCQTELDVPLAAQSTMCKRCSSHVDLKDYEVRNTVSKNFKTKGRFVIEQGGCLLNTDCTATTIILRGKVIGKLVAEQTLEIYDGSEIKGQFQAGHLVIPAGNHFRWNETIRVKSARIEGELVGNIVAEGTVQIGGSARVFGDLAVGGVIIEPGAVLVGQMQIGLKNVGMDQPMKAGKPTILAR